MLDIYLKKAYLRQEQVAGEVMLSWVGRPYQPVAQSDNWLKWAECPALGRAGKQICILNLSFSVSGANKTPPNTLP